jgi:hypothetical protein
MTHFHEHCADLGLELSTALLPRFSGPRDGAAGWALPAIAGNVRRLVHETLHSQIGMRRERDHFRADRGMDPRRYRALPNSRPAEAPRSRRKDDRLGQSFRKQHEHVGRQQFLRHRGS